MSHRLLLALALGAALHAGCVVEPRRVDAPTGSDAGVSDAGAGTDAGSPDAAPASCHFGASCPEGSYCDDDGVCTPLPGTCKLTSDCRGGERCMDGACGRAPRTCARASDCTSPELCLAAGWCAPPAASLIPLVPGCAVDRDCGPGGICLSGACARCSDRQECRGGLECDYDTGACRELSVCADASACFPGNECIGGGCERTTAACATDRGNDVVPEALDEAYHGGLSICGSDTDVYALALAADHGALIAVTSTRSQASLVVELAEGDGDPRLSPARLELPGLTLIGVPSYQTARALGLRITSADASAAYAVDVRQVAGLCAGDALDLYGDDAPAAAPLALIGSTLPLVGCPDDADHVRVGVTAGDTLRVVATFGEAEADGADLDLEILDGMGTVLSAGTSPSPSREETSWTADVSQELTVRVSAKRAPTAGVPYSLALTSGQTRAEACAAPAGTLSAASPTAAGSFAQATNLGAPECSEVVPLGSRARLYELVPPTPDSVVMLALRQTRGEDTNLALAVLADCLDDASARSCAGTSFPYYAASLELRARSGGPLYAVVSSDGVSRGVEFELSATFIPVGRPPNDVCAAAQTLVGSGTVEAPTFGADDDARFGATNACGTVGTASGPDRFYALSLDAGEPAALELRGSPGGFLWVATDCRALTTTCTVADSLEEAHPARVALRPARPTRYLVAVDGEGAGSEGAYQLRVVRPPELECLRDADCGSARRCDDYRCVAPPANDRCPGTAVTLVDGRATLQGSTGAADGDYETGCAFAAGQADVVYAVTVPPGARALVARVTAADWDPVLSLRLGACDTTAAEVGCADDVSARLPAVALTNPAAGTYYVVVDAYDGRGPFTLELAVE